MVEGALGCDLCEEGAKSILFLTGECPLDCFYCPTSERRREGGTWINERPVESEEDVLEEIRLCGSEGTSVTGGDPATDVEGAAHWISTIREAFGPGHHVHMYTALPLDEGELDELEEAGLDELRLHPPEYRVTEALSETARRAADRFALGAEIPAVPGRVREAVEAVKSLPDVEFVNVNELELSDTNADGLREEGHGGTDGVSATGSLETAEEAASALDVPTRICTASFKDSVQLRNRYVRRARNVATVERYTKDGTLLYGYIEGDAEAAVGVLGSEGVPEEAFHVSGDGLTCDPEVASALADELREAGLSVAIEERLPTHEGTLIERQPL
ncbi:MAG: hypothetical protein MAG715_01383 [Methanonatronarchaeales archaeon]|nr:hypothetical protein [Methanonatronarchaeales archaeon]